MRPELVDSAIDLTPEYIITRYPNAANGIPAQLYNERMARDHIEKARMLLEYCRSLLGVEG